MNNRSKSNIHKWIRRTEMIYFVNIEQTCLQSDYESKEYGSWSETWDNKFCFVEVVETVTHNTIKSKLDIKPGEEAIVVWIEWSSGDSFGYADNKYVEPIAVFKDVSSAEQLKEKILEHVQIYQEEGNFEKAYHLKLTTNDGQTFDEYCDWIGYFERLEEVHIEHTIMKGKI